MGEIGRGKFSLVYNVRHRETNELFAMKYIDKEKLTLKEKEFLREEIQIVKMISHPNVVQMKEIYENKDHMFIIMECIQGGELFDHIKNKEMGEKEASFVAFQILEALQYLHLSGIVHRDLKPENLLIEKDPTTNMIIQTKIADFGLSKIIIPNELMHESCGTPAYVAPEVLRKVGYYKEVDVWSAGIIFYTMISRCLPFHSFDRK